jgi:hypothetical protein
VGGWLWTCLRLPAGGVFRSGWRGLLEYGSSSCGPRIIFQEVWGWHHQQKLLKIVLFCPPDFFFFSFASIYRMAFWGRCNKLVPFSFFVWGFLGVAFIMGGISIMSFFSASRPLPLFHGHPFFSLIGKGGWGGECIRSFVWVCTVLRFDAEVGVCEPPGVVCRDCGKDVRRGCGIKGNIRRREVPRCM